MAPQVTDLLTKVPVTFRSSDQLRPLVGHVFFDEASVSLQVELQPGQDGARLGPLDLFVPLDEVLSVKVRDYSHENTFRSVLAVVRQGAQQVALEFESADVRDTWAAVLRAALQGRADRSGQAEEEGAYLAVARATLQEPGPGALACVRLELSDGQQVSAEVPGDTVNLRQLAADFVQQHSIMPSETSSLFRLLRSIAQRTVMERETAAIIDEIDASHMEKLREAAGNCSEAELLEQASARLRALARDVPLRVGQQGPGAALVKHSLLRCAQRMRYANESSTEPLPRRSGDRLDPGAAEAG